MDGQGESYLDTAQKLGERKKGKWGGGECAVYEEIEWYDVFTCPILISKYKRIVWCIHEHSIAQHSCSTKGRCTSCHIAHLPRYQHKCVGNL